MMSCAEVGQKIMSELRPMVGGRSIVSAQSHGEIIGCDFRTDTAPDLWPYAVALAIVSRVPRGRTFVPIEKTPSVFECALTTDGKIWLRTMAVLNKPHVYRVDVALA